MSNETKKTVLPNLRFPEFKNTEEWKVERFGDIYEFKNTNSLSRDKLNYNNGSVKNIHYGDIHTKFSTLFDIRNEKVPFLNPSVSIEKVKPDYFCIEGDVIFADASEDLNDIGKSVEIVYLNNEKILSGLHTLLARQKKPQLVIGFGGHLFMSRGIRSQIQKESQGTKVLGISAGRLSNIKIFYPKAKAEQQKITDCLSSLDDLIAAQSQKVDALKDHKKGLMQQLLPTEGETVPQLRFLEFQNAEEWKEIPIGEKVDLLSGYPFKSSEISEDSSGTPLMRGINITEGFIRHSKEIDRSFLGNTQKLEKYKLHANDLVIGMDGSKVGRNSALIGEKDSNSLLVQRVARLRAKCDATIQFIFQHINSIKFHSYVDRINTSGGIPHISADQISTFKILFPSLPEQQKVADCLSSLDDLIAAQSQKVDALKDHKKGLMQQLFPSPQEE